MAHRRLVKNSLPPVPAHLHQTRFPQNNHENESGHFWCQHQWHHRLRLHCRPHSRVAKLIGYTMRLAPHQSNWRGTRNQRRANTTNFCSIRLQPLDCSGVCLFHWICLNYYSVSRSRFRDNPVSRWGNFLFLWNFLLHQGLNHQGSV